MAIRTAITIIMAAILTGHTTTAAIDLTTMAATLITVVIIPTIAAITPTSLAGGIVIIGIIDIMDIVPTMADVTTIGGTVDLSNR